MRDEGLTVDTATNFQHLVHLVFLEWHSSFLTSPSEVDLGFLSLEHGTQGEELSKDAAERPLINRWCVVPCSE